MRSLHSNLWDGIMWSDYPCDNADKVNPVTGYGRRYYKGKQWRAHRAEWDEKRGPIPDGLNVLHRCDNKPCKEINHLFLGTQKDNMQDMVSKGRHNYQPRKPLVQVPASFWTEDQPYHEA